VLNQVTFLTEMILEHKKKPLLLKLEYQRTQLKLNY
jgi:hypothetical protein